MVKTSSVVRTLAFLAVLASLFALLLGHGFGTFEFEAGTLVKGIIILFAGLMIGVETLFTDNFPELANLSSLNVWLGIPSALIAIAVGLSFIFGIEIIAALFEPFLGGIYIAAITILTYEWATARLGIEPER